MRLAILALSLILGTSAAAFEIKTCEEANVSLTSLILPAAQNSKAYYNGQVGVFGIDQIEPACCSYGVAIIIPDKRAELAGERLCFAVLGLGGVNVGQVTESYDPKRGLSLSIPAKGYDPEKGPIPGEALKLLINLQKGTVVIQ